MKALKSLGGFFVLAAFLIGGVHSGFAKTETKIYCFKEYLEPGCNYSKWEFRIPNPWKDKKLVSRRFLPSKAVFPNYGRWVNPATHEVKRGEFDTRSWNDPGIDHKPEELDPLFVVEWEELTTSSYSIHVSLSGKDGRLGLIFVELTGSDEADGPSLKKPPESKGLRENSGKVVPSGKNPTLDIPGLFE